MVDPDLLGSRIYQPWPWGVVIGVDMAVGVTLDELSWELHQNSPEGRKWREALGLRWEYDVYLDRSRIRRLVGEWRSA